MEVDQCYACAICDFMTFRHINLEHHFRLQHDGIPPKSVFKRIFEPMCTFIVQMDELLCSSLHAAQNLQLAKDAERSAISPRVKSETMDTMQSSSKIASDFTNDVNDDESKLCPVELSKLPPVDKSHSATFHIKPDPDEIKKEIPELVSDIDIYHLVSSHEDLEVDIAGQSLLSVDNCFSVNRIHEEEESPLERRDKHMETRSTLRQGHLTLESRNRNSPEIEKSWICWVCFRKFARCVGVERSLFLKHSKAFCPYAKNDLHDVPVDQTHVRLFCPRSCNFVTSDANAFCKHVYMCVKSEEHTQSEHFMRIQSSFEVYSLTPEVARDLELLSALPNTLVSQRLAAPKKPVTVIGQNQEQNLTKLKKHSKKSVVRAVGEKQTFNEPNLIHSGTASLGSQLMDTESDKQLMDRPDQLKLKSIGRCPRGMPVKDKANGDGSRYSVKLQNLRQIKKREVPIVCSDCGKGFRWHSSLYRHIACQHSGKQHHACMHCRKDFTRMDHLQKHLLRVHKEKPFLCVLCDSAFDLSSHLQYHMITKHSDQHEISTDQKKAITGEKSKSGTHHVNGRLPKTSLCLVLRLQKQNKMQRQCTTCGKTLSNNFSLHRHMRIHHAKIMGKRQAEKVQRQAEKRQRQCTTCGKTFANNFSLHRHMKIHRGKILGKRQAEEMQRQAEKMQRQCTTCGKTFANNFSLHRHMKIHRGEILGKRQPEKMQRQCTTCGKTFANNSTLCRHMKIHCGEMLGKRQPEKMQRQCTTCGKMFAHNSSLQRHMKIHHGKVLHKQCTMCGKMFANQANLQRHMKIHHGKVLHKQCTMCGKMFANQFNLLIHMKIHRGEILRKRQAGFHIPINFQEQMRIEAVKGGMRFICVHCDKSYPFKKSLRRHILTKHTKDCPFRCSICGMPFGYRCDMERHEKRHTGGQQFKTKNRALSKQIESDVKEEIVSGNQAEDSTEPLNKLRRPQTKLKNLICKVCGLRFKNVSTLSVHSRKHAGSRPFQCKTCRLSFKYHHRMVEHMARHTGGRPYKCSKCGDCFKYVRNLKEHNLNVHMEKRSFECNLCGKDFMLHRYLKKHMRYHQKPYSCRDCEKSFPFPYLLHNHLKVHSRGMLLQIKASKKEENVR